MSILVKFIFLVIFFLVFQSSGFCQDSNVMAIKIISPVYPEVMIHSRLSGKVVLKVEINNEGKVTDVHFIEGVKPLAKISEKAVKKWLFNKSDVKTTRTIDVILIYTLLPSDALFEEESTIFSVPYTVEVRARKLEIKP